MRCIPSEFRQVYRDLAKAHDVTFMPFYLDGVAGIPSLNIADGMHPNAEGSRLIAGTLWRTLEPLLEKSAGEVRLPSTPLRPGKPDTTNDGRSATK